MPQREADPALQALERDVLTSWRSRHSDVPSILYHYTSAEGLTGILRTRSLWLTDLRYMNDLSELQYARSLVTAQLSARSQAPELTPVQQEFLRRITSSFDPFGWGRDVFAASFCEDGNLLSQWRAYRGHGGGYAIGFDFFHLLPLLSRLCVLRKVVYEEAEQNEIVNATIDAFLNVLRSDGGDDAGKEGKTDNLPAACEAFAGVIGEMLFSLKHPDFREEREWRLVHFATVDPRHYRDAEMPEFRSFEGNVIPYYSVSFDNAVAASRDDTFGFAFPLAELMIGPTINADLNRQSVKSMLLALNPDIEPAITRSEIPLRWL